MAKIGKALQAGEGINGFELFGSAQSEYQPAWAQLFKFGSIALLLEVPQVLFRLSRWENLEHAKKI